MEVETHNNYIGGRWVPSRGGSTYTITNPAGKSQALGEFQSSTEADAHDAVAAALGSPRRMGRYARALQGRRAVQGARPARTPLRRDSPHDHLEEGKPIADAMGEVRRAMNIIEYAGPGRAGACSDTPPRPSCPAPSPTR